MDIKKAIKYLFNKNSKLENVGTKADYHNYLKSIFPNTTFNEIAFHHSNEKVKKFKDNFVEGYAAKHGVSKKAIFFLKEPLKTDFLSKRPHLILVKLNTENTFNYRNEFEIGTKERKAHSGIKEGIDYALKNKFDSVYFDKIWDNKTWSNVITVFSAKQIHILGDKKDFKKFKKFKSRS